MARITLAETVDWMELNRIERPKRNTEWSDCVVCAHCSLYPDSVRFGTPSKTECVLVHSIYGAFTRVSIMYANFNLIDENLDCCERRGSTRRLWEVSGCAFCFPYDRCGVALYGTGRVKNENFADTLSWGATTFQSPSPTFVWCTENCNTSTSAHPRPATFIRWLEWISVTQFNKSV